MAVNTRSKAHRTLAVILALAVSAPAAAQPAARPSLQKLDVFSLEHASDVQISPDGREVAYVRVRPNINTDGFDRSIWLLDVASRKQRQLVGSPATRPRWSPDGNRIIFAGIDERGRQQLYWVGAKLGDLPRPVTCDPSDAGDFAWSSDGRSVAFVRSVDAPTDVLQVSMPRAPTGARWAPPPRVVQVPNYSRDGEGFVGPTRSRLVVVPADGGAEREIGIGALSVTGDLAWTPDGAALVFVASPTGGSGERWAFPPSSVYAVDVRSGVVRKLTSDRDVVTHASLSPDGRTLAIVRHAGDVVIWNDELWLANLDGGDRHRQQPSLEAIVYAVRWTAAGALTFSYGSRGENMIATAMPGGIATVLARHAAEEEPSLADDGSIGFASVAPDRPREVGVAGPGMTERVITSNNADILARRTIAKVTAFDAPSSFDQQIVPGFAMLPPGYVVGRRYPTVLYIHGGPYGDEGPQWHLDLQLIAASGYVVLYSNPRGSTSYGTKWLKQLTYPAPQHDFDDLMGVVDAAIARGLADPARLYVTGSSYGAEMTTWIIGRTARFRAAAAEKPAVDFGATDLQNDQYRGVLVDIRGLPWEHPDTWWRSSPISLVGDVRTPTMLIVGEDDRRTPPGEAQQFYNALQLRHIPSALVLYPRASHETLGVPPSQTLSITAHVLAWFGRYR